MIVTKAYISFTMYSLWTVLLLTRASTLMNLCFSFVVKGISLDRWAREIELIVYSFNDSTKLIEQYAFLYLYIYRFPWIVNYLCIALSNSYNIWLLYKDLWIVSSFCKKESTGSYITSSHLRNACLLGLPAQVVVLQNAGCICSSPNLTCPDSNLDIAIY